MNNKEAPIRLVLNIAVDSRALGTAWWGLRRLNHEHGDLRQILVGSTPRRSKSSQAKPRSNDETTIGRAVLPAIIPMAQSSMTGSMEMVPVVGSANEVMDKDFTRHVITPIKSGSVVKVADRITWSALGHLLFNKLIIFTFWKYWPTIYLNTKAYMRMLKTNKKVPFKVRGNISKVCPSDSSLHTRWALSDLFPEKCSDSLNNGRNMGSIVFLRNLSRILHCHIQRHTLNSKSAQFRGSGLHPASL